MEARVEHDIVTRRVRVWIIRPSNFGGQVLRLRGGGVLEWLDVAHGGEMGAATLDLPEPIFALLIEQGMQVVPASSVMEEAWKDSRSVRDRLLSIVEALTDGI